MRQLRLWTLQEPEIERCEYQDNSNVYYQPPPEVMLEEQDIHTDNDGYQREHVKDDGCLSAHRLVLLCAAAWGKSGAGPQINSTTDASKRVGFLVFTLAGLGVGTLLAAGLGWAVSRRVLRPLTAVTTAAQAASQEHLDRRLALAGPPDELKQLADTFDAMLARRSRQ